MTPVLYSAIMQAESSDTPIRREPAPEDRFFEVVFVETRQSLGVFDGGIALGRGGHAAVSLKTDGARFARDKTV